MAGKNTKGTAPDRFSWKAGDVIVTDRNGKQVDMKKFAQEALRAEAAKSKKKK